jgi:replicative DNA helicase
MAHHSQGGSVAANIEMSLLTQVVRLRDFHSLEKAQINESFFSDSLAIEVFRYLKNLYHGENTSGEIPTEEMVRHNFPSWYPFNTQDTVPILADQLRREHMKMELMSGAQSILEMADRTPLEALAKLREEATRISALAEIGSDLSMSAAYDLLLSNYETVQNSNGITGIPYPWDPLNEETQGLKPSDYVVLFGRPKSMKTWIALYIATRAYRWHQRRVLFYTREMNPSLVAQRVAALICGVDYHNFKTGKLQPDKKAEVFETLRDLRDEERMAMTSNMRLPYFTIISDRGSGGGGGGVTWLGSKIKDLDPDLVVVDGMYLMKDDNTNRRDVDWKVITNISRGLRGLAQEYEIPIIGVTQANRSADKSKGDDLTELAYSDAIGQDADAVFRTILRVRQGEDGRKRNEIDLVNTAMREGKLDGITIHAEPATNFGFIRTWVNQGEPENNDYGRGGRGGGSGGGGAAPVQQQFRRPQPQVDPRLPVPRTP